MVPKKRTRQEPKGGQLVPLPVLSDDTVILSPNIDESETDQILNAKYFVSYTEKMGTEGSI